LTAEGSPVSASPSYRNLIAHSIGFRNGLIDDESSAIYRIQRKAQQPLPTAHHLGATDDHGTITPLSAQLSSLKRAHSDPRMLDNQSIFHFSTFKFSFCQKVILFSKIIKGDPFIRRLGPTIPYHPIKERLEDFNFFNHLCLKGPRLEANYPLKGQ
jgi:hypothetical protein